MLAAVTSCMRLPPAWLAGTFVVSAVVAPAASAQPAPPQVPASGEVAFSHYPAIATATEVISRLLTPITAEAFRRKNASSGKMLQSEMFDISGERFRVYVPQSRPAGGYGLLVFVPPWPEAMLPEGWAGVLDRYGIIFVSADRSSNIERPLERRVPLALAGLENIRAAYQVDPARTFVGGFSGGSRMAMRIALAYPDEFQGVLLDAGSDPIGESQAVLPPPPLMLAFQTRTRIAFVTGAGDETALSMDSASRASMQYWCVENVSVHNEYGVGHDAARPGTFEWAIRALITAPKPDSPKMAACRAARAKEAATALAGVENALHTGRRREAHKALLDADTRYGGLIAPQSIELADRCSCGIFDP